MKNQKKTDEFFEAVEKAGLMRAFEKISTIAADKIECYLEDLVDDFVAETEQPVCRVRYAELEDGTEHYIFEIRQHDEDEYHFAYSYQLEDDRLSYQALTQIREMMKLGYKIIFQ
ncbi:MAG: hypothetical protein IKC09_08855 [Oscillospiraceae bacterium]|nr:hypothetical protein [Oscillospiraceae bacterium]